MIKRTIYPLFALSGACALIYEVLWTKYLSLTFGTTMVAISIVAATFMGGLALGSFLLGRFADHESNLLRLYAWLEVGIAVTALLFPPTLRLVEAFYVWLHHTTGGAWNLSHFLHIVFSAMLLLPPTICMGGTFPLMCRFFARRKSGGQIGRLYALNTIGATAGAFSAGYLLIPTLGLSLTGYLAIAGNLMIAAVAFRLARQHGETPAHDVSRATRHQEPLRARQHLPVLLAIGLTGAFSLAYEMLWTRVLLLFLGNTTYAFALMLSAYLVGIALGGAIYARKVHPTLNEKQLFVILTVLMGVTVLASAPFYDQLVHVFQWAHDISKESWGVLSLVSFGIVLLTMLIPTVLSGALLPAAVAIIDPGKGRTGEGVGLVVLHNTVGAVIGSLIAGIMLVPLLGILDSFRLLATLNILLGMILCYRFRRSISAPRLIPNLAAIGIALSFIPADWDEKLMNSGIYIYAPKYRRAGGIEQVLKEERILEVIEGRDTTVAIHESQDGSYRFFTVNGKTDGGTGRDMATQLLVGHLPLLLHPAPQEVMVIGLGTGITLSGLADHPTEKIDCVEISAEVVSASRWFEEANGGILQDPKIDLHINDGRNMLLINPQKYDVIVSEPSNPWQAGNANLFTADFYRLANRRLKPGGLFCQWIGLYDITPENLRTLFNTFLIEFPKVMVFKAGSDLIMVGAAHDLAFDYRALQQRLTTPGIAKALNAVDIHTPGDMVAFHYLFSEAPLTALTEQAGLNTDDRPLLEYAARYNLGEHTLGEFQMQNMRMLIDAQTSQKVLLPVVNMGDTPTEIARALRDIGESYIRSGRPNDGRNLLRRADQVERQTGGLPRQSRSRGNG
ncbi:MAG: fused MFS/spermidine synthase [Desulfuromonadales bacterium]|nr:fused MFS/spermidine synthase [Desulfuromonadales bacterium]